MASNIQISPPTVKSKNVEYQFIESKASLSNIFRLIWNELIEKFKNFILYHFEKTKFDEKEFIMIIDEKYENFGNLF